MIAVKNLTKIYGKDDAAVHALSECSITFDQGKFTAIIGTSGSGKSTLLHLAAGLDTADTGEIFYDSTNILSLGDVELSRFRLKNIGVVFQFFNLIPELTARENILLPLMLDKTPVDTSYFEMLTDKLEISNRLSHYPSQLSGGQQQRTAIARALIHKPSILLCDEPTGNLDSKSGAEVLKLLSSLQKSLGLTIVMVTHDEKIAAQADKIVRIEDGKICG
ncbi:MAG: ABC transporter ATP-binding protein [Oscillospiraceae bacterium]|nr:ABC transporter ATP-binding protein [Oscillospiraceae bacterium]